MTRTRYAVLGLGEAGRTFAAALTGTADVAGWDPFATAEIADVARPASPEEAVRDADFVLSFTTAAYSGDALQSTIGSGITGRVYADFATAGAGDKRALAAAATPAGLRFVDAAIMAPVRRGAADTPILLAGDGAADLAAALTAAGLRTEVLEGPPGTAAARKLLRSMLVKGLTGVLIEALRAAEAEDLLDWFSQHATDTLTSLTPATLAGFLDGTRAHSTRRIDEMLAAATMAEADGGQAAITRAVADLLTTVEADGIPAAGLLR